MRCSRAEPVRYANGSSSVTFRTRILSPPEPRQPLPWVTTTGAHADHQEEEKTRESGENTQELRFATLFSMFEKSILVLQAKTPIKRAHDTTARTKKMGHLFTTFAAKFSKKMAHLFSIFVQIC